MIPGPVFRRVDLLRSGAARLLAAPLFFLAVSHGLAADSSGFVRTAGSGLSLAGRPFYAVGVNSYFLQELAARGDTGRVHQIFRQAHQLGLTAIRTWAFHDAPDSTDPASIQWGPGLTNEAGLRGLDFVLARAPLYGLRLILPLVNNWDDYGGMNQYVRWYARTRPGEAGTTRPDSAVSGPGGRSYLLRPAGSFAHDDFYRIPEIREWYRLHIFTLLTRVNTLNNIPYRDDPAVLMWELANEPRSSDPTGETVHAWLGEMSAFLKSVDPRHLLASGEEGLETSGEGYSDPSCYGDRQWLFDGTGGVSYARNLSLPWLDAAVAHCYPEAWGLSFNEARLWAEEHRRLARQAGKPFLLEEAGSRVHPLFLFQMLFADAFYGGSAGILPWQMVYDGRPGNDGYAFSCPANAGICRLLGAWGGAFAAKSAGDFPLPSSTALLGSYPNPFNAAAVVSFTLSSPMFVRLTVWDALGRRVALLAEGDTNPGIHYSVFQPGNAASGVYYLLLETPAGAFVCPLVRVK
ncbi:MAG: hypothetical protein WB626_06445 [Bacteroidota bacterium]